MKFFESVSSFWEKGITFEGTASRSEYWWAILFIGIVYFIISFFCNSSVADEAKIQLFWEIIIFVPHMALTVRRFNDINIPTWIPIVALSFVLFFDLISFDEKEYLLEDVGFVDYFSSIINWFIAGVCLAPSAAKPIKEVK